MYSEPFELWNYTGMITLLLEFYRFNRTHIYKSHMFGSPSVIVTSPDACRRVLMDNETFGPGWPKSVTELLGDRGFHGITNEEHRRLRRLTAGSLSGQEALSFYIEYIKDIAITSLKDLSEKEKPIELLTEMRKNAFNIIMYIILGIETSPELEKLEKEYHFLTHALKAMRINLPGFAYHRGLQVCVCVRAHFDVCMHQGCYLWFLMLQCFLLIFWW